MTQQAATPEIWHLGSQDPKPKHPYIMLVDGAETPVLTLDLPNGIKGHAREQVAAQLLRDMFPQDAFEFRPCLADQNKDTWTSVVLLPPQIQSAWRKARDQNCISVLPNYFALPHAPNICCLRLQAPTGKAPQIIARIGETLGFCAEPALALAMLTQYRADIPELALSPLGDLPQEILDWAQAHNVPVHPQNHPAISLVSGLSRADLACDLSRDILAERGAIAKSLKQWRLPLTLGVAALVVWGVSNGIESRRIEAQITALNTGNLQAAQALLPQGTPILDVRLQVSQAIKAATHSQTSAQTPLEPLAHLRQAAAIALNLGAKVQSVSYAPTTDMVMVLELADFATLDRVLASMAFNGHFASVIESSAAEGSGISVRLRIASKEAQQ